MKLTGHLLLQPALSQLCDHLRLSHTRATIDIGKYHRVPFNHHLHYPCITVLKGIHTVHILIDHNAYGPGEVTAAATGGGLNTVQYLWREVPDLVFGGLHVATTKDVSVLKLGDCRFG